MRRMLLAIPLCAAICALVVRAEEQERQVLSCSVIKEAIDALPAGGGRVVLAANSDYICTESIRIKKNNVHLIGGAGTWIRLADGVNQPVVLVGDASQPPTAVVEGVVLSGLNIDGNRLGQEFECNKGACEVCSWPMCLVSRTPPLPATCFWGSPFPTRRDQVSA